MRFQKNHLGSIGFWVGFLLVAINPFLEVTLVTGQGQVESVSITPAKAADSTLLLLGCYTAIGVGLRLFSRKKVSAPSIVANMVEFPSVPDWVRSCNDNR